MVSVQRESVVFIYLKIKVMVTSLLGQKILINMNKMNIEQGQIILLSQSLNVFPSLDLHLNRIAFLKNLNDIITT